jgi:cell wall-associated NlpC family hydrolase
MRRAVTSVFLLATLAAVPALSLSGGARANPIESKQAEARRVMQEVAQINKELEQRINQYDYAQVQLGRIRHQLRQTKAQLRLTKRNLAAAELTLRRRAAAIYTSGGDTSSLAVLLGATSFNDLVNRLDESQRVSQQDSRIVNQVTGLRNSLSRKVATLDRAQTAQQRVVATREAERRYIEGRVAQVNAKLKSIQAQLVQMRAAEARRQEQLRREAAARLAVWKEQQRQRELQAAQAAATRPPSAGPAATAADTSGGTTDPASSTPSPPSAPAPPSSVGSQVVAIAMRYLGVPYVWGGASPSGFDCSGLVVYVFQQVGISLPHYTGSLFAGGTPVARDQLEPGDLVFFDGVPPGHVGIYVGGDQFIHAPETGDVVKISTLSGWNYVGARRYG